MDTLMPKSVTDDPVGLGAQAELSETDKLQLTKSRFEKYERVGTARRAKLFC